MVFVAGIRNSLCSNELLFIVLFRLGVNVLCVCARACVFRAVRRWSPPAKEVDAAGSVCILEGSRQCFGRWLRRPFLGPSCLARLYLLLAADLTRPRSIAISAPRQQRHMDPTLSLPLSSSLLLCINNANTIPALSLSFSLSIALRQQRQYESNSPLSLVLSLYRSASTTPIRIQPPLSFTPK